MKPHSSTAPLTLSLTLPLLLAGVSVAQDVPPPEAPAPKPAFLTGSVSLGVSSGRVYRGERLTEGSATLTPSLSLTLGGHVTVFASGTLDTQSQTATRTRSLGGAQSAVTEEEQRRYSDTTVGATFALDTKVAYLSLTGTYTALTESDDDPVMGTLSSVFHLPLSPGLSVSREAGGTSGWYLSPSLNPSFDLGKGFALNVVASAGYYTEADVKSRSVRFSSGFTPSSGGSTPSSTSSEPYSGWSDATGSLSLAYSTGSLGGSLGASYSAILDQEFRRRLGAEEQPEGTLTGFLGLSYSF